MPIFPDGAELSALKAAFEIAAAEETAAINAVIKAADRGSSPEAQAAYLEAGRRMDEAHIRAMGIYKKMLRLRLDKWPWGCYSPCRRFWLEGCHCTTLLLMPSGDAGSC